jgi:hypothetical protein
MADLPKYYSGLINIEAQTGANITLGDINHYTTSGDVKTYDFSHLIPAFDAVDENGDPTFLTTLELPYVPIKDSFMLILDGMVMSSAESVNPDIQAASPVVIGDYRFLNENTIEFLFEDGLKAQSETDTPVLLARYARR